MIPLVDRAVADAKPAVRFKVASMDIPDLARENDALGFDLDADDRHSIDNKLGSILQLAEGVLLFDGQARVDMELAAGRMVVSGELHWNGGFDEDDVALQLNGAARVYGRVRGLQFVATEPGELELEISLFPGIAPLPLRLVRVKAEIDLANGTVTRGKIGGGIPHSDIVATVLPRLFEIVHARVTAEPHAEDSLELSRLFDVDKNGIITESEVLDSGTIRTVFSPDVDLLASDKPHLDSWGHESTKDSISAGFRFTAVRPE